LPLAGEGLGLPGHEVGGQRERGHREGQRAHYALLRTPNRHQRASVCHLKRARAAVRVVSCAVVRVRSHLEFVLGLVEAKAFGHQVQAVHHRLLCAEAPSQKQLL
jgi:hypothetical protein